MLSKAVKRRDKRIIKNNCNIYSKLYSNNTEIKSPQTGKLASCQLTNWLLHHTANTVAEMIFFFGMTTKKYAIFGKNFSLSSRKSYSE